MQYLCVCRCLSSAAKLIALLSATHQCALWDQTRKHNSMRIPTVARAGWLPPQKERKGRQTHATLRVLSKLLSGQQIARTRQRPVKNCWALDAHTL